MRRAFVDFVGHYSAAEGRGKRSDIKSATARNGGSARRGTPKLISGKPTELSGSALWLEAYAVHVKAPPEPCSTTLSDLRR